MCAVYGTFLCICICVLFSLKTAKCNPITNSNFNENIREFSLKEDNNSTAKTLLKGGFGRNANFAPPANPARIKEVSDNAVASSSHGRGYSHHEYPGYGIYDHEETPYYGYEHDHVPYDHGYNHHGNHDHELHYSGYGHRHYNHALAAKAVLWPLAGIALLGAAAALVTNPVLLQLGVATGKRKRRDTELTAPDLDINWPEDLPNESKMCVETKDFKSTKNITRRPSKDQRLASTISNPDNYVKIPIKIKSD
ncbi:unnamed protein product [Leptosia nina]|uniref:Uncharacterized protein n=1 Tax=Leptosia nina TaxID=320188 RepID=A0AAV1J0M8_9NEOP